MKRIASLIADAVGYCIAGFLGLFLGVFALLVMLGLAGYAYENTWHTPEGFYPMTLYAETAYESYESDNLYGGVDEFSDKITIFRDSDGIIRAINVTETSSVTDNTYWSDYKIVDDESVCDASDRCLSRDSDHVADLLAQFDELACRE